jgi:hypothetical protein
VSRRRKTRCDDALVPQDPFADRLDPATYAEDDDVVGFVESTPSEDDALWLRRVYSVGTLASRLRTTAARGGAVVAVRDRNGRRRCDVRGRLTIALSCRCRLRPTMPR